MKRIILVLFIFGINSQLKAQENPNSSIPISISYWGNHLLHPGLKIGTQNNLLKWDKIKERKKGTLIKHKTLVLNPELGIYFQKENHTGVLLNADFGIEVSKNDRKFFRTFSLGLGYFRHFNSGITYVSQNDGSIDEKKHTSRGYFMPSLNYTFGQHFKSISWFSRLTLASKLKYNTGISLELFFEAGIKFKLF